MQSLRYKENRKVESERRREKPSATLYRKILISRSSGLGIRQARRCIGSIKKKAGTMKRDVVLENAHILVIGFWNSNFFISNQR